MAGATPLGMAGDPSLWPDSKDAAFCTCPLLETGHAVGVLIVLECCWHAHDSSFQRLSGVGVGRWDEGYHPAGERVLLR